MKEVLKAVGNGIVGFVKGFFEVLPGIITGMAIVSLIICVMLVTAVSARSNECDDKGDWLGYASHYSRSNGCQFKVDGVWTNIDTLTFVLKNKEK